MKLEKINANDKKNILLDRWMDGWMDRWVKKRWKDGWIGTKKF